MFSHNCKALVHHDFRISSSKYHTQLVKTIANFNSLLTQDQGTTVLTCFVCTFESDRQSFYCPKKFSVTLLCAFFLACVFCCFSCHSEDIKCHQVFQVNLQDSFCSVNERWTIRLKCEQTACRQVRCTFLLCVINWLYLFGVAHALHVGCGDAGAGESLSWVLPVAAEHLTLQVRAHWLNVVAPDREQTQRTNVMKMLFLQWQSNLPSRFKLAKMLRYPQYKQPHRNCCREGRMLPKREGWLTRS